MGYEFYIILAGSVGVLVWLEISDHAISARKNNEFYSKFIDVKYPPKNGKYLTEVKILKSGESFGELALLNGKNKKRNATIISKEDSHFGVLDRKNFLRILSKNTIFPLKYSIKCNEIEEKEENKLIRNVNFLQNFPFFQKIPIEIVKSIYLFCEIKEIALNAVLYKEGEDANFFYMIKSGSFLVKQHYYI